MRKFLLAACLIALAANLLAQQVPRYQDEVSVNRILIDVRAVDDLGRPILGLDAANFSVRIDRKAARVESALWVADAASGGRPPATTPVEAYAAPSSFHGRVIVFLFQKDLEPTRIVGLMRMLVNLHGALDTLGPDDRVAVLSYDSHLRVWLDLTNDFDRVRQVLQHDVLFGSQSIVAASEPPSLLAHMDRRALGRAYPIERALSLVGAALEPLPGAKSLVLVGHGFGRLSQAGLRMERDYGRAVSVLQRARASVFCLDVTDAAFHSLEGGLELVAAHTGGFYVKTHEFPQQALDRLSGVLTGYYSLFVDVAGRLRPGAHDVQVTLNGVKGTALATNTYFK